MFTQQALYWMNYLPQISPNWATSIANSVSQNWTCLEEERDWKYSWLEPWLLLILLQERRVRTAKHWPVSSSAQTTDEWSQHCRCGPKWLQVCWEQIAAQGWTYMRSEEPLSPSTLETWYPLLTLDVLRVKMITDDKMTSNSPYPQAKKTLYVSIQKNDFGGGVRTVKMLICCWHHWIPAPRVPWHMVPWENGTPKFNLCHLNNVLNG